MSEKQTDFNSVSQILIESGFLHLRDYVYLQSVRKKPKDWLLFARYFHPNSYSGLQRLRMWRVALNSGKFSEDAYLSYSKIVSENSNLTTNSSTSLPDDSTEDPVLSKYKSLLHGLDVENITRFSSGVEGEIMRDVLRTFQNERFFQEGHLGRNMLCRVLVAVSKAADASVGYCQGMNFVVGVFLHSCCVGCLKVHKSETNNGGFSENSSDTYAFAQVEAELRDNIPLQWHIESVIFDIMLTLIEKDGKLSMVGLWGERIPRLKLRVYQLDRLLRWFCPHLQAHFAAIDLSPEVLTAQWFITLFSYTLSPWDTMRVWDYVFLGGWEALFRVAVSLLSGVETQLLAVEDMEGVSLLLKQWRNHKRGLLLDSGTVEEVFARVCKQVQQVTDEVLLKLSEAFAQEVLLLGLMRGVELNLFNNNINDNINNNHNSDNTNNSDNSNSGDSAGKINGSVKMDENSAKNISKFINISQNNNNDNNTDNTNKDTAKDNNSILVVKPVYWLQRYAYKLTPQLCLELSQLSRTIARLDAQIDTDKQLLTQKILAACDTHDTLAAQRQSVARCVVTLRERLTRVSRRMQRATQRAKVVTLCASEVFFMLQQVELLEVELKRAQASGKNIIFSDETHQNSSKNINKSNTNNNNTNNGNINNSKRSRFFERFLNRINNAMLNETATETVSPVNNIPRNRNSWSDNSNNDSKFVFGGSRSHHKHNHLHHTTNNNHNNNQNNNIKYHGASHNNKNSDGVSRRQRLASLLIPSPSRDTLGKKTQQSSNTYETHLFQDTRNSFNFHLQSLQSLTASLSDLLSPNSTDNTDFSDKNKTNFSNNTSSKNLNDNNLNNSFSGWTSPTHFTSFLASSFSQMYTNNPNKSTKNTNNNLGNSDFFQSLLFNDNSNNNNYNNMVPRHTFDVEDLHYMDNVDAATYCDTNNTNNNFTFQLQLQPPLTEEECVLVGDLDRDSETHIESQTATTNNKTNNSDTIDIHEQNDKNSDKISFNYNVDITNDNIMDQNEKNNSEIDSLLAIITEKEPAEQMRVLERESRAAQHNIIVLQRVISEIERVLQQQERLLHHLQVREDEASDFKAKLCDQLHLLVEDSNRGRSQKLLYVADNFVL